MAVAGHTILKEKNKKERKEFETAMKHMQRSLDMLKAGNAILNAKLAKQQAGSPDKNDKKIV
jgi:hypothetical protein